jgi:surface protein
MTIADSLTLLNSTKTAIAAAIEDKGVTVGDVPFADYAEKISEIEGGGVVPFTGEWTQEWYESVYAAGPGSWSRPDWLPLPAVANTEQKFVGLHAVWPQSNFLALSAAGAYTVDWGDGVVENFASGVTAQHIYDFNNAALDGTDAGGTQYKQAIVVVTPQSGQNLTSLNLNIKHSQTGLQAYASGWLDILISGPNLTTLTISANAPVVRHSLLEQAKLISQHSVNSFTWAFQNCSQLKSIPVWNLRTAGISDLSGMFSNCVSLQAIPALNTQNVNNMVSMFTGCSRLQSIPSLNTQNVTSMSNMFSSCGSLQAIPALNTQNVNNMSSMFSSCSSLQSIPALNTQNVTSMSNMFSNCGSLQAIPALNTQNVTSMSSMFSGCRDIRAIPALNTQNVTSMNSMFISCVNIQAIPALNTQSATNMSNMFDGCISLQSIPALNTQNVTNMNSMFLNCNSLQAVPALNTTAVTSSANFSIMFANCNSLSRIQAKDFRFTFSVSGCKLSAAALDEIYTNLPTVTGQTITVTNNWGTATDNPSIATAKGWTVTG